MKYLSNYSLLEHNTFGINAKCRRFVEYASVAEAEKVVASLGPKDIPLLIIGGGSNLLLTRDFDGTVLHSSIKGITSTLDGDKVFVRCGSGEVWDEVVEHCVSQGWYGAENLSLIPGEVGASAVQNIGAYGVEAKDIIKEIEAIEISTGEYCRFSNEDCCYAYRQSRFKGEWKDRFLITYVTYQLSTIYVSHLDYGNIREQLMLDGVVNPTAKQLRSSIIKIRNAKLPDPKVEGNAGSFFMNPVVSVDKFKALLSVYPDMPHYPVDNNHEKIPAGWMIDQCGWKGKTLGRAGVHAKQALVLVNKGGATGIDVINLCNAVRKDVAERFGVDLQPEVNFV